MVPKKLLSVLAILFVCGCGSAHTGRMQQSTDAGVTLREANYKIVKAGARGSSYGFNLLGFIPITTPKYADAKNDLYDDVKQPLEGRSIALANQTEDRSTIWLLLFSLPKIVVTADVIEFNPTPAPR